MGSINKSHNENDGGVLLFAGELIMIYCDAVNGEIGGKESVKGRIYLTTHRIIFIATPLKQNSTVKSFCAPFFALHDITLEQPVFAPNYIRAKVRDEADQSQSFTFKLKFFKGGAIEFARAMDQAARVVTDMHSQSRPPPAFVSSPDISQYYQAPPNVYAPGYNCGFQLPTQQFPEQPPIGFIYATSAPPPYPGMTQPPPPTTLPSSVPYEPPRPAYGQSGQAGYPGQAGYQGQAGQPGLAGYQGQAGQPGLAGYQGQAGQPGLAGYQGQAGQPGQAGYPGQAGRPGQAGYSTGPPGYGAQQSGPGGPYPGQQPPPYGYPNQQAQSGGYPASGQPTPYVQQKEQPPASGGYPGQAPPTTHSSYPGQGPPAAQSDYPGARPAGSESSTSQPMYPNLNPQSNDASAWPSAPSINPDWQEEKKRKIVGSIQRMNDRTIFITTT